MALELIELAAVTEREVTAAAIVETTDGWIVRVKCGLNERLLAAPGKAKPLAWASAPACVAFLAQEAGILQVEVLALDTDREPPVDLDYSDWLRSEVQKSIDDLRPGVPSEELERDFDKIKSVFRKRLTTGQT